MSWLTDLVGTAGSAYNANQNRSTAKAQAAAAAASANASNTQSNNLLKIALIGGGVLLVIGLVWAFVRGK